MKKIFYYFALIIFLIINFQLSAQTKRPYLLLISFDGFRWDYLNRGITPNLDSFKEEGVTSLSLRPAFPSKTFPNHYSIITGMYPAHHGIITNSFGDPFNGEWYRLGDPAAVTNARWYLGEAFWETAERQGITTASYFWPGSEMELDYRHPTYYEQYEHTRDYKVRVNGVVDWLKLPYDKRPHFITLYFDATDTYGHKYGPDSPEVNNAIQSLDSLYGYLETKLSETNLADSLNIVIVSDHGMTEVSDKKIINIEDMLADYDCKLSGTGPLMMIKPDENKIEEVYLLLKNSENHFKTYKRESMPEYYHFSDNPFIYPILLVADLGWSLMDNKGIENMSRYTSKGNHGYEKDYTDMHGIFIAKGPAFRKGFKTGTLWNIDIYPMLCRIFDIMPRKNIDGTLERIEFILK